MSAYENVVGGGLKLKGGIKKKKKKQEEAPSDPEVVARLTEEKAAEIAASGSASHGAPSMTEAERRRRETKLEREIAKAQDGKVKSHREKVKDFNNYLAAMTEHYDLPKVSKGN